MHFQEIVDAEVTVGDNITSSLHYHIHTRCTQVNNPSPSVYQQSTRQIWKCVTSAVRAVVPEAEAEAKGGQLVVRGVGFDATCSLVLVDGAGKTIGYGNLMMQNFLIVIRQSYILLSLCGGFFPISLITKKIIKCL